MPEILDPHYFLELVVDDAIPLCAGWFFEFAFALEEEAEEVVLEASLVCLEAVLSDGHSESAHADFIGDESEDAFDVNDG